MDGDPSTGPSPERARTSTWGGPETWAELHRIAEDARLRTGFRVSAIEVLRGDGLLELVAFSGAPEHEAGRGGSFSLSYMHRVLAQGTRYGKFVFLAEEDMNAELQDALRGYGYVPALAESSDPERWRALDMLVGHLIDGSGRTRALFHLDEPLNGRRPRPHEMQKLAESLELALQAVLATVDREELTHRARLDETARAVVRAASVGMGGRDLLDRVHPVLVAGFRARAAAVWLHDEPDSPVDGLGDAATLPAGLRRAVEGAVRRAWQSRTVIVADLDQVWGDDELDRDHRDDLTAHLLAHAANEMLLVPVGAGHEPMGALVVVRESHDDRWSDEESTAALGVGHDLGRALLSTRAHEREQHLIKELQRLDEYRRRLIATVSHELKNPLGVVVGHLEMLETVPGLPAAAETSLRALGRGAARLTSVVDDLLLLSQMSSTDEPPQRLPVDLAAVLSEVVEDESIHAEKREVNLQTRSDGAPVVTGEPEELRRLVANLVGNAVKYSRAGGTVDLLLQAQEDEVVFTCTDNGIGISTEDQEQLFTEFFRSTNPDALQRPGTGLGLAIVSRIAARHNGRIDVDSQLGIGTTIRVVLPS